MSTNIVVSMRVWRERKKKTRFCGKSVSLGRRAAAVVLAGDVF